MGYALYAGIFGFRQVGRAVGYSAVGTLVEFAGQHGTHICPGEIRVKVLLDVFQGGSFALVLLEELEEGEDKILLLRILYHSFYPFYFGGHVADGHIGIAEDQLSLPDGCLVHEFDTFAGGIYLILADGEYHVQLQASVSGFHVDARLTGRYPVYAMFVQDFLYFIEVRHVAEPPVKPPEKDNVDFAGFYVGKQGMYGFTLFQLFTGRFALVSVDPCYGHVVAGGVLP